MTEEIITWGDKLHCIERELGMRKRVYPRLVADGKMTQDKAAREIAIMEAIRAEYADYADEAKKVEIET